MTLKSLACAALISLTATAALACGAHEKQAQSCIPGMIWDSESQSCVKEATS